MAKNIIKKGPSIKYEICNTQRGPPLVRKTLSKLTKTAKKSVCKIIIANGESKGSGFLAWFSLPSSNNKVMCGIFTSKHVIKNPLDVDKKNIIFSFEGIS